MGSKDGKDYRLVGDTYYEIEPPMTKVTGVLAFINVR